MKEQIMEVLTQLVSCDSVSCTTRELKASEYIYDYLTSIPYFKEHPELVGKHQIPNDIYGRFVPYAVVLGNKKDTVILSGHSDVVSTEVYGEAEPLAFTVGEELEAKLASMDLDPVSRADMESGEWLWGRGVADMKSGVALNMVLTRKYAEAAMEGKLDGSIIFMAVPDEESYSAGMRAGVSILRDYKKKYDLKLKLLIDPEPAAESGEDQVMSIGSVGKIMPVILTQGKVAHTGHCFNGISGLNMLAGIYQRTNGSLDFCDAMEGEATMPPTWANMRDMKLCYDVSLPYRGYGYFTILNFETTLEEYLEKLKAISAEVFEEEVKKWNDTYQAFKKINKFETKEELYYETCVYTFAEFCDMLREKDKEGFEACYKSIYDETVKKIEEGMNYPDATVYIMDQVLNYADIKNPLVLIGVAPPYYPATHSDKIEGLEGMGSKIYDFASELSEKRYQQGLVYENYFMGISDNSYTSVPPLDFDALTKNYPLWGKQYDLDFDAIEEVSVPSILYGPIGREYHQWTERVNKRSLLEVMPDMLQEVIAFAWNI